MEVRVSPRRRARLISSRSAMVSRPGPGVQLNGFTVRVGAFITTFHAVCSEASISSPISLKFNPLAFSRSARRAALQSYVAFPPGTSSVSRSFVSSLDAFYEWERLDPKRKQPYAFTRADGDPIVFAGLREWWRDAEGHELNTATIITTEAGPDMPIHDRQPVVLERANWDQWLDPELTNVEELKPLLVPTLKGTLIHHRVSRDVSNVRNDGPELIEEISLDEDPGQLGL